MSRESLSATNCRTISYFPSHSGKAVWSTIMPTRSTASAKERVSGTSTTQRELSYMATTISEALPNAGGVNGSTRFDLRRTDDPVVSMKFLVFIPIYDLIINIGSVISIWFGLSVISIPDITSGEDMEKAYIQTWMENLEIAQRILKKTSERSLFTSRGFVYS